MATVTRLSDGAPLALSGGSTIMDADGVHNFKRSREYTYGKIGESRPLSSVIEQKAFSINFLCTDETGLDQYTIGRFFSIDEGFYRLDAPEFGVNGIEFTVVALDVNVFGSSNSISITCQSRYGDLINTNSTLLYTATLASAATFPVWNGSFNNTTGQTVNIKLSITAPRVVTWKAGTVIKLSKATTATVTSTVGDYNAAGVLSQWNGLSYSLDSYDEVVSGLGVISAVSNFFQLLPGENSTLSVASFVNPIVDAVSSTVKIEAVSITQKT